MALFILVWRCHSISIFILLELINFSKFRNFTLFFGSGNQGVLPKDLQGKHKHSIAITHGAETSFQKQANQGQQRYSCSS